MAEKKRKRQRRSEDGSVWCWERTYSRRCVGGDVINSSRRRRRRWRRRGGSWEARFVYIFLNFQLRELPHAHALTHPPFFHLINNSSLHLFLFLDFGPGYRERQTRSSVASRSLLSHSSSSPLCPPLSARLHSFLSSLFFFSSSSPHPPLSFQSDLTLNPPTLSDLCPRPWRPNWTPTSCMWPSTVSRWGRPRETRRGLTL